MKARAGAFARARLPGGFTAIEVLVSMSLLALVVSVLHGLQGSTERSSRASIDSSGALRSVALATRLIRQDVARAVFVEPGDLVLAPDGRGISLLVPRALGEDLTSTDTEVVSYYLVPVPAHAGVFWLVRQQGETARTVGGCLLASLQLRLVEPGALGTNQPMLAIDAEGAGTDHDRRGYAGSSLVPVNRLRLPRPYRLAVQS